MNELKPEQVASWQGRLVDVRELDEFASERLAKAECVPMDGLLSAAGKWDRSSPILLMCKSGSRAKRAAEQLASVGFEQVSVLSGGIDACKKAGVDVIVNRKSLPIMRQVMIGAGSLLLVGLLLSRVNPWFILIDWFVACGLIFAGVTGFCAMGRLLERMPWNRRPSCSAANGASCAVS